MITASAVGLTDEEYRSLLTQLGRQPNDLELGLVGALWSEHCSYKSSREMLAWFQDEASPAAGQGDNAGVVPLSPEWDVAFKVESHNHPSYVEPFHGAATGVGGIVRDVLAMGAEPVALLDSLRFGTGSEGQRLLPRIVEGIAFYGNAIGIPTVGGEVSYGPGYETNPLVNVLCAGIRPHQRRLRAAVTAPGLRLLLLGAATGRDGIHGASLLASREFAADDSAGLRPAVQVGDPFMGKLLVEATLAAVATGAVAALQDCGAAGLSSALSEMASAGGLGIRVDVSRVPRREADMSPYEVMLSESQERMVLAVDPARVEDVARAVEPFGLALADIGEVVPGGALEVTDGSDVQASLPARLLTHGAPRRRAPQRIVGRAPRSEMVAPAPFSMEQALQVLGHPECRSRADIFTQYDSMVKTSTVAGPGSDAAILRLRGSAVGLALTLDGQGRWGAVDAYAGGARAVAEAAMNLTVTGARPLGLSDGLNAGSPDDPEVFQAFALMVQGIADAARALRIPVTGGNVSFYNQTGGRVIWPTPVIGMVGVHPDPLHPVPTGFPGAGLLVYRLGYQEPDLAATVFRLAADDGRVGPASRPDFERLAAVLRVLGEAHHRRLLRAAHDISDGGLFVALAEMVLAGSPQARGVVVELPPSSGAAEWFNEGPGQAIVAVDAAARNTLETLARTAGVPLQPIGRVEPAGGLRWERGEQAAVTWTWGELWTAWQGEVSRGR